MKFLMGFSLLMVFGCANNPVSENTPAKESVTTEKGSQFGHNNKVYYRNRF